MAFRPTAEGIVLWRFIAAIEVGPRADHHRHLPARAGAAQESRGAAFAHYQFIEFLIVPVVALLGWLWIPRRFLDMDGWRWVVLLGLGWRCLAWWLRAGRCRKAPAGSPCTATTAKAEAVLAKIEAGAAKDVGLNPCRRRRRSSEAGDRQVEHHGAVQAALRQADPGAVDLQPDPDHRLLRLRVLGADPVDHQGDHTSPPACSTPSSSRWRNPVGPLLGLLFADKMERRYQIACAGVLVGIFIYLFAIETNRPLIIVLGVHGHPVEQLDLVRLPRLSGRAVSDADPRPRPWASSIAGARRPRPPSPACSSASS